MAVSGTEPESGTSQEPELERDGAGRRRSRVVVASVAAAVLLAGGGGAWFAAAAPDGGERGGGAAAGGPPPPPLALDGYTESGTGPGIAPGEPDPRGVVYRAAGPLPEGPGSAHVYRPEGSVGAGEVARLAKALGVEGAPRVDGSAWKVGPDKDGSGAALSVERQAPGTWTFGTAPAGDNCLKGKECPSTTTMPPDGLTGTPVGEAAAKEAAAPVLEALGQGDAALDATQVMGAVRVVNADPVVGGLPTYGWSTGVQVGADGSVTGGSGRLKAPVEGHEYPVVGAARALELLNEGSGSAAGQGGRPGTGGTIGGCATPAPLEDSGTKPVAPCKPAPDVPRETVTVSGAVFGLAAHYTGGRPALVPSWLFEVAPTDGAPRSVITYPAVSPEHLAPAPPPQKPETPESPAPESPGTDKAPRQVESYSTDGKVLTARFWGGVCSTYTLKAEESESRVRLSVVEKPAEPGRVCILIAKEVTATVALERPVGDRQVVDAASGEKVARR
ncbi:hypothetical protein [Streptomyces sp. NPDC015131]|uniref:hypothetical protein n=1 Tax=Streptomyces sp. NPDC015131 TaxID=3364941 RepID=UPI00370090CC